MVRLNRVRLARASGQSADLRILREEGRSEPDHSGSTVTPHRARPMARAAEASGLTNTRRAVALDCQIAVNYA